MTKNISLHHHVMRCWSTWTITLYDGPCALNLRNVNEPASPSGSLFSPGLSVSVERDCLDLSIYLSPSLSPDLTTQPVLQQTVSRTIHARPTAAVNNGRSVVHLSTKERQTDGHENEKRWMTIPISRVSPLWNNTNASMQEYDKEKESTRTLSDMCKMTPRKLKNCMTTNYK